MNIFFNPKIVFSLTICLATSVCPVRARAETWEGIWAAEISWCKFKDQIGEHDPAPIKLDRKEFVGLENRCEVADIAPVGKDLKLRLNCNGEGSAYEDAMFIRLSKGKLRMKREAEDPIFYYRCK